MKKLKYVFMVMAVAFVAVITLISCSKATKSYSDKINNAYQSGEAITYDDVLKELGNEAINLTKNGESGVILVVRFKKLAILKNLILYQLLLFSVNVLMHISLQEQKLI